MHPSLHVIDYRGSGRLIFDRPRSPARGLRMPETTEQHAWLLEFAGPG